MSELELDDEAASFGQPLASGVARLPLLAVEGPMIFARAVELRATLLASLSERPSPIQLDLSSVTELDSAGVQLLLLLKMTAKARGISLRVVGQSSIVLRTLELLRLDEHFGTPEFVLFGEERP